MSCEKARSAATIFLVLMLLSAFPNHLGAQTEVAAEVCNASGVCTPMDPATAIVIIALAQLATELSKEKPFGPNNDLVKSIRNMISDLKDGMGENNDLVKTLKNINSDLRCGPGPNNEVVKFLSALGIKVGTGGPC